MATRNKRKINGKPFKVQPCSVCGEWKLCFGEDSRDPGPDARVCRDCLKLTLGWVQMSDEMRVNIMALFDRLDALVSKP